MKPYCHKLITYIFLLLLSTSFAHAKDSAIVVFDGSGSMLGQIEGKTKIEIARDVMGTLVSDWTTDIELGLIAYGHRKKRRLQ
ncbi:MAG: Ca-activated chloride channel family protein [Cocleimonas sp.]|jgi:Ca-activated chloride channel family protein